MKIVNIKPTKIIYYVDVQRDDGELASYRTMFDVIDWDILVDGEWKPVENTKDLRKQFFDFHKNPFLTD